jgi:hypothetical protein
MFDKEEVDHFSIVDGAKNLYVERNLALAETGFIYSDGRLTSNLPIAFWRKRLILASTRRTHECI